MTREQLEHAIRAACRTLLIEGMINVETFIDRIHSLGIDETLRDRLVQWTEYTAVEL